MSALAGPLLRASRASTEHGICHLNHRRHKLSVLLPLMLALLIAQVGAQGHAYSHLQTGSQQDGLSTGARVCADCCLSAPLLSSIGAAAAPALPRVDTLVSRLAPRALSYLAIFQPPGFRSRAPPDSP